jgi:hypothetical protein
LSRTFLKKEKIMRKAGSFLQIPCEESVFLCHFIQNNGCQNKKTGIQWGWQKPHKTE